jgi:hypothetical protein
VIGIAAAGEQTCLDERSEPVGQHVGGDALFRAQQLPEAPRAAENDVAQDQQTPSIAQQFERQIDRAAGPMGLTHSATLAQNRLTHPLRL